MVWPRPGSRRMPSKPLSPCAHPGCPLPAVRFGRCAEHAREVATQRMPDGRESAALRGYDRKWRRVRAAFLKRHPICELCGAEATEVHHITPVSRGGTHEWGNLQALCKRCHSRVTAASRAPERGIAPQKASR